MPRHKPANKKERQERREVIAAQQSMYQGQIPPPDMMEHFQKIQPDLPERIMSMAEREAAHRHSNESKTRKGYMNTTYVGMLLAFLSVLVIGAIVAYALYLGYSKPAMWIACTVIVSLAGVFVYRKKTTK